MVPLLESNQWASVYLTVFQQPILQMQYAILYFLRATLVPELSANITAGTTGNIKFRLITITTMRAFPNQLAIVFDDGDLAVEAPDLAVVALCVEFCIHDVVVDIVQHLHNRFEVVLHIGNFDIADGATRRQWLELTFKLQLVKCIDFFSNMHMVAIGDIALIRDAFDDAKTTLQTFTKLVRCRLKGCSIQAEVDIVLFLPGVALVVHMLHNL